ncbi:MAG: hypothetical protein V1489_02220 [Candidatus Liptonbacteria bacterium]
MRTPRVFENPYRTLGQLHRTESACEPIQNAKVAQIQAHEPVKPTVRLPRIEIANAIIASDGGIAVVTLFEKAMAQHDPIGVLDLILVTRKLKAEGFTPKKGVVRAIHRRIREYGEFARAVEMALIMPINTTAH